MLHPVLAAALFAIFAWFVTASSCVSQRRGAAGAAVQQCPGTGFLPAASEDPVVMTGRIERKSWAKSGESWQAGGGEYFVLVRDDVPASTGFGARVILRETAAFPTRKEFGPFAGRRVEIRGRLAGYVEWTPDPRDQHPISHRSDGKLQRGGGILVDAVRVLDDKPAEP